MAAPRSDPIQVLHDKTAIYTRDPVVDELLGLVDWPNGSRRLLEPSCGDGAFLVAALEKLLKTEPGITAAHIAALLRGYEIHAGAASEARGRIVQILQRHGFSAAEALLVARQVVVTGDFLTNGPEGPFEVILGNPPFLRMLGVPSVLRMQYLDVVPELARADLLHAFLALCARLLPVGGELAFVTADRWLFNQGASRLREALGDRFAIHVLKRLDVTTAFYRPKQRKAGTPPRVQPVAVVLRARTGDAIPLSRAPIYPGAQPDGASLTLDAVAELRCGPYLGPEGLFTVDESVASRLPVDSFVPIVDTEEIRGTNLGPIRRYALRTQPQCEPARQVLAHIDGRLAQIRAALRPDDAVPHCLKAHKRWMPKESFHQWDLTQERLVVPRITKRLRCIRLPAGVLPVNHGVSVVGSGTATLDELQEVLESEAAHAWVAQRAPMLEGGYMSVTTTLLRSLPVPNVGRAVKNPNEVA